jgi:hypothetical protein
MGIVGRLAVGDVQDVGAETGVEVPDRRAVEVARQGEVDRVVRGRRRDLPALRVQQPLPVRVPVDLELEAVRSSRPFIATVSGSDTGAGSR